MPLVALGIGAAVAGVAGAKISSDASTKAANIAATSTTNASAAQTKANEETLAFQKQQAENDYKNQEITRQANYNQYATGQTRLQGLDSAVGLAPRQVPAYVASQDPNYTGTSSSTPSAGQVLGGSPSTTTPSTSSKGSTNYSDIGAWLQNQAATNPNVDPILKTPGGIAYYTQAIQNSGGLNAQNADYWVNKSTLASAGGAVGATSKSTTTPTSTSSAVPYSVATYLQQRQNPLPTSLSGY